MSKLVGRTLGVYLTAGLLVSVGTAFVVSGHSAADGTPTRNGQAATRTLLTAEQWKRVDSSVDRGLAFLAKNQEADGFLPDVQHLAQPAVTVSSAMAFVRGHQPGAGTLDGAALEFEPLTMYSTRKTPRAARSCPRIHRGTTDVGTTRTDISA